MIFLLFFVGLKYVTANQNASSQLIEQAAYISSKFYNHQFATSVVWSDNNSDGVTDFLMKFPGSVVITPLSDYNDRIILDTIQQFGYLQTVFFSTKPDPFEKFMNLIRENIRFPIRLILVLTESASELSELSTFMEIAWQNNLVDIVIIFKNQNDQITLSTYFPHSNGNCGYNIHVTLKYNENVFPNKFKNFNGCPIRVGAKHHAPLVELVVENGTVTKMSGYDATILKLVINKLNATLDVTALTIYGICYTNGTITGGFSDLVNNISDILLPAGVPNRERYLVTQSSHVYYDSDIHWFGPKRRVIYHWIKLLIPFFNIDTIFLCLAFALFVIVAIIIRRLKIPVRGQQNSLCFQTFSLLVGQDGKYITEVSLLNNLFLLWIWFCFIVRIEYQGFLVDSLQTQILETPFSSLQEALKRVDGYGGFKFFLDYYKDTPLEQDYVVMLQVNFYDYLNRVIEGERFLLPSDAYMIQRVRHLIQIVDEPISISLPGLYMRPGWPAAGIIDSIIVRLLEAGITERFLDVKRNTRIDDTDKSKQALSVDISMISSSFYAMGFMWAICSVTLVLEIIYFKYSRNNKMKQGV